MEARRRGNGTRWLHRFASGLRSSLWFVPVVVVVLMSALAVTLIWVDERIGAEALEDFPLLFGAGAESERSMLAAIATSMITMASITFSITMVAVAQSANQYTSRVLANFMRDRTNQVVLGVFVGVFAYCLIVIRTIRGSEDIRFVPSIAAFGAFVMALIATGFLIYFIHHIAQSLRSSVVLDRVRVETEAAMDRFFPASDLADAHDAEEAVQPRADGPGLPVHSLKTGYIQYMDEASVLRLAGEKDLYVRMSTQVGDFVAQGEALCTVHGAAADDDVLARVCSAFTIASGRTVDGDPAFGIRQMVDVALKALSPAVNNTTTGVRSVDHISALLGRLARRRLLPDVRETEGRLVRLGPTWRQLVDTGFDEIRRTAAGNVTIHLRILSAIERIAGFATSPARLIVLQEHVERVRDAAAREVGSGADRVEVHLRCDAVRERIGRAMERR